MYGTRGRASNVGDGAYTEVYVLAEVSDGPAVVSLEYVFVVICAEYAEATDSVFGNRDVVNE